MTNLSHVDLEKVDLDLQVHHDEPHETVSTTYAPPTPDAIEVYSRYLWQQMHRTAGLTRDLIEAPSGTMRIVAPEEAEHRLMIEGYQEMADEMLALARASADAMFEVLPAE